MCRDNISYLMVWNLFLYDNTSQPPCSMNYFAFHAIMNTKTAGISPAAACNIIQLFFDIFLTQKVFHRVPAEDGAFDAGGHFRDVFQRHGFFEGLEFIAGSLTFDHA